MSAEAPVTVVLADDHAVVRAGLRALLERSGEFRVLAEAGDAETAVRSVLAHRPDVLVLDLNMPGELTSLQAIPQLATASPETRVVVLTMQESPEVARQVLRAGAGGYVLKDAENAELVAAIKQVAAGGTYLNPSVGASLATAPPASLGPPDDLTEREAQVLRLLALGHTNAEIGNQLYLSMRTVEAHRSRIQQKLNRFSRAQLVRYALDHGLLSDEAGGASPR
jgi:two-component system response regulator NreC